MDSVAELNVFINDGAEHVKIIMPAQVDAQGNPLDISAGVVAQTLKDLVDALLAAGFTPSARRQGGGGWGKKEPQKVTVSIDGEEVEVKCPTCEGQMWDNRAKKADGSFNAKAPDFGCRNKACGGRIWKYTDFIEAHERGAA